MHTFRTGLKSSIFVNELYSYISDRMAVYTFLNVVPSICFCVLLHMAITASAENVLISASLGEGSHYFVGKTIGKYLAKQGHNVTALLSNAYAYRAKNLDDSELNFIIFNHSVPPESVLERHKAYSKVIVMINKKTLCKQ